MTIVDRIRDLCEMHGETIASLERKIGVGNAVIRRWNKSKPTAEIVMKVARFFNVTPDYLMYGVERSTEDNGYELDKRKRRIELIPRNIEDEITEEDERIIAGVVSGLLNKKYRINVVGGNDESNS